MLLSVLTAVLLAQAPKPALPFTEVFVRDGRIVVGGGAFEAVADQLRVSADGRRVQLLGKDEPVLLVTRSTNQSEHRVTAKQVILHFPDLTLEAVGASKVEITPRK